jgi:hypothetical protein
MLLSGGSVLPNTYIVANISGSGTGSTWTVSVSQNLSSTSLTGTVSVPVYEAGWDHVVPGTAIEIVLDLTTQYIIEPRISYSAPGYTVTARTVGSTSTQWVSAAYGANRFVAISGNATTTAYSSNGTIWTQIGAFNSYNGHINIPYVVKYISSIGIWLIGGLADNSLAYSYTGTTFFIHPNRLNSNIYSIIDYIEVIFNFTKIIQLSIYTTSNVSINLIHNLPKTTF